ncbi:xylulose kinase-like [Saccostrea echinata]|uniref:xylulose kinase-like n=1 Tax=Saccostrea echinata TaxID=191078 RepID=UPI002A813F6E|nr:xylulose kinase-like [Saccostrea echinata]
MDGGEDRLFLGLDFSTQQIKAEAINDSLQIVNETAVKFDSDLPEFKTHGGVHIHNDNVTVTAPTIMWVKAFDLLLEKMKKDGFPFHKVACISGAGQQHGSVYWKTGTNKILRSLDEKKQLHKQLQNCFSIPDSPVWMDASTTVNCRELEEKVGGPLKLAEITGSRSFERYTGTQIMKISRTRPSEYKDTERISLVSSFAASLFIGDYAPIDLSDGSGMNLLDIRTKKWSPECLQACGSDLSQKLGDPVPSKQVIGNVSQYLISRYNFSPNCKVVAFTGDNPASLAGMAPKLGDVVISLGSSDTVFSWSPSHTAELEGHIFVNPIDSNTYMSLVCFKNGSLTRERIKDESADGSWDKFSEYLKKTPIGNNGNIGIYFDVMEIQPLVQGIFRFNKSDEKVTSFPPEVEVRAVIEGQMIARKMYMEMEMRGMHTGLDTRILATGGASLNKAILQVISDVFGAPVFVSDIPNSAGLGSCYRAKHGLEGCDFSEVVKNHPQPECVAVPTEGAHEVYKEMSLRYRKLEREIANQQ